MANQAITSGSTSLGSSGLNSLLTLFMAQFRSQKRNVGTPLNYCNSSASNVVSSQGQTVTVPIYPTTQSSLLIDGQAVASDDNVGTSVSVTLNKHRYLKFSLTQMARMLDGDKTTSGLMLGRVFGLLNDIESDVMSVATTGFSTNVVGTYNTAITEAVLSSAHTKYKNQAPPSDVPPIGLISPGANAWGALEQLPAFRDFQVTGEKSFTTDANVFVNGLTRYGVRWVESQAMPVSGTSIDNLIFHPNAICTAFRAFDMPMAPGVAARSETIDGVTFQMVMTYNGDRLQDEMTLHALYGFSVGREIWGVQLKS